MRRCSCARAPSRNCTRMGGTPPPHKTSCLRVLRKAGGEGGLRATTGTHVQRTQEPKRLLGNLRLSPSGIEALKHGCSAQADYSALRNHPRQESSLQGLSDGSWTFLAAIRSFNDSGWKQSRSKRGLHSVPEQCTNAGCCGHWDVHLV